MTLLDLLRRCLVRDTAGPHPEPDKLFSYHALELSPAEAESVQAHLALCPRCARAVADLEAFPAIDPPSDLDHLDAAEVAAGWDEVRARLGGVEARVARLEAQRRAQLAREEPERGAIARARLVVGLLVVGCVIVLYVLSR